AFKLFQGNMNLRDNSIGKGYGPALGIGFKKKALRGEFDFDYVYEEAYNSHSSKFRGFSGMFNVFADLNISGTPELTPYIGFGAGVSHIRLRTPEWHGNGCAFSWQAAAGISYAFSPKFAVDIGYRYFDYGTPRIQHTDYSFDSKQFFLEMKYFF
ncbi:MAG: porin family protein, partial [Elusimicrobiales bacterium]|nr:porin family protein [Elusimicrobiales bacterium]